MVREEKEMDFSKALAAACSLSLDDRIRLVEEICNQIAADQSRLDSTEAQKREQDKRLCDNDANRTNGAPGEVVGKETQARAQR